MSLSELACPTRILLVAVLLVEGFSVAFAEPGLRISGTLLLPSGEVRTTEITSLIEGEGRFTVDDGEATYSTGQWVRWGYPKPPAPRSHIRCHDGSVFVAKADWSTKVPVALAEGKLDLEHAILGKLQIPCHQVALWLLEGANEPALARTIAAELRAAPPQDEDRVWLTSGDSFSGQAQSFDGVLRFRVSGQELQVASADVAAVAFASRPKQVEIAPPKYLLGFEEGTLVAAAALTLDSQRFTATTPSGLQLSGGQSRQLVYVQSLAGIAYLSDADPLDYRHTPYFDIPRPMETNRNLDNGTARVLGLNYLKCVAMHTASRAVYQVPPGTTHFAAEVAIDDSSGQQGSAIFRIYRIVNERPELAYETPVVRGGDPPQPISVSVDGASVLILVVDFADFGDELDHCLWLDPRWVSLTDNG